MNKYLQECINKHLPIVCDYDGVLFEARFGYDKILSTDDDEEIEEMHKEGIGLNTTPINFMINLLNKVDNPKYVLSHIHTDIEEQNKINQLAKYYNGIKLLRANSVDEKIEYLLKIYEKYGGFIYIDDTLPYLGKFEKTITLDNANFFHVSSLYV